MRNTVGDGGIDGVFGEIAFNTGIVMMLTVFGQWPTLPFHFVSRLPTPQNGFSHSAHRLRIRGHHRKRTKIVQNILCCDGFAPNTAFGKRDILGNARVEVMTHHQHIEMFVNGIDGKRTGGISGTGQHIQFAAGFNNIWCVSTTGALGVIGMDGAAFKRSQCRFNKTRFI